MHFIHRIHNILVFIEHSIHVYEYKDIVYIYITFTLHLLRLVYLYTDSSSQMKERQIVSPSKVHLYKTHYTSKTYCLNSAILHYWTQANRATRYPHHHCNKDKAACRGHSDRGLSVLVHREYYMHRCRDIFVPLQIRCNELGEVKVRITQGINRHNPLMI